MVCDFFVDGAQTRLALRAFPMLTNKETHHRGYPWLGQAQDKWSLDNVARGQEHRAFGWVNKKGNCRARCSKLKAQVGRSGVGTGIELQSPILQVGSQVGPELVWSSQP